MNDPFADGPYMNGQVEIGLKGHLDHITKTWSPIKIISFFKIYSMHKHEK